MENKIKENLQPIPDGDLLDHNCVLHLAGLWPRITPVSILRRLSVLGRKNLPKTWKESLIHYAEAIKAAQHSEYLYTLAVAGNSRELAKEVENFKKQGSGWDPRAETYSDWLLFEIDNSVRIRPIQAMIADAMISPPNEKNSVFQLVCFPN